MFDFITAVSLTALSLPDVMSWDLAFRPLVDLAKREFGVS